MRLDARRDYAVTREGPRHQLVIPRVGEEDFANYSCEASNSLGRARAAVQLRGNPAPPIFSTKVKLSFLPVFCSIIL